jgi:polyhydroxyalkanoate synthesis repressor PhaR
MSTIRRYDSRKLYDPTASRYVSLDEIATRIRRGEEIEVVDNVSGENVTALTLMQIILDEGKSGRGRIPPEMLHDLVRVSGEKISNGVGQVQTTMNRLMRASLDRLAPIREAKRDIARLEERLRQLEGTLSKLDKAKASRKPAAPAARKAAPPPANRPRSAARSTARTAPRAGKAS